MEAQFTRSDDEEEIGTARLLRIPKTAEVVADRIRARIIRGELGEGDFLPPEAQLTASLGISRPTLREAFRVLETEGLISILRGSRSGARVHRPRVSAVSRYAGYVLQSDGVTIADIYEARLAIEPFAVGRLARTQPPGATDRLRAEADRMTELVDKGLYIEFMTDLAGFHRLLVEVAGNRTLLFVTRLLQNMMARYQVRFFDRRPLPDEEQRRRCLWGIRSFRKLITLIDAGDAAAAEAHWRLHLTNANRAWAPEGDGATVIELLD